MAKTCCSLHSGNETETLSKKEYFEMLSPPTVCTYRSCNDEQVGSGEVGRDIGSHRERGGLEVRSGIAGI